MIIELSLLKGRKLEPFEHRILRFAPPAVLSLVPGHCGAFGDEPFGLEGLELYRVCARFMRRVDEPFGYRYLAVMIDPCLCHYKYLHLAGTPLTVALSGTFFTTTDPAPTMAPSPIVMPCTTVAPAPMCAPSPILQPPHITAPGPTWASLPIAASCSISAFFFQAEDGIRDDLVTGVQTCALPI